MRVLVVDNFDSFTYNLVQQLGVAGARVTVRRNDAVTVEEALGGGFDRILISPGPGGPERAGVSCELVRRVGPRIPVLGVCLGHQCVARAFGGEVIRGAPVHGKTSLVAHDGRGVLAGLKSPLSVARYHSLEVARRGLPRELEVTAWTSEGTVMGVRHRRYPIEGIQFHPESFLTEEGDLLVRSFLGRERAA